MLHTLELTCLALALKQSTSSGRFARPPPCVFDEMLGFYVT